MCALGLSASPLPAVPGRPREWGGGGFLAGGKPCGVSAGACTGAQVGAGGPLSRCLTCGPWRSYSHSPAGLVTVDEAPISSSERGSLTKHQGGRPGDPSPSWGLMKHVEMTTCVCGASVGSRWCVRHSQSPALTTRSAWTTVRPQGSYLSSRSPSFIVTIASTMPDPCLHQKLPLCC